jgi:hypothetical protein
MDKQNSYRKNRFPPTNYLAAAMKSLPTPGLDVSPRKVEIDAGQMGSYSVTFIARLDGSLQTPTWSWGIESSVRNSAQVAEGLMMTGKGKITPARTSSLKERLS